MSGRVKVVNMERDVKTFELEEMDGQGKPKRDRGGKRMFVPIVLGSQDDRGQATAPQPEIVLDGAVWDRLCQQKAVTGYLNDNKIAAYPMPDSAKITQPAPPTPAA